VLAYVRYKTIPALRKKMRARGYIGTGDYAESLEAQLLSSAKHIVRIGIYASPAYAEYVEGSKHAIEKGTKFGDKAVSGLVEWLQSRSITFHRKVSRLNKSTKRKRKVLSGAVLTDTQAAWAIISKYRKRGRKARFFIDVVVNQHIEKIKDEVMKKMSAMMEEI
jgi:hypothetical protein